MPVPTRRRSPSPECPNKRSKVPAKTSPSPPPPLYGVKPLGNALFGPPSIRHSLGNFACLPDEVLLHILSFLSATDLLIFSLTSRSFFAFAAHEPLWKDHYLQRAEGRLLGWRGSWRKSYIARFGTAPDSIRAWPTDNVAAAGLYSDILYQPYLCATIDLHRFFDSGRMTIPRQSVTTLTADSFASTYAQPSKPVIITGAMDSWPASSSAKPWSLAALEARFPDAVLQAEALSCTFSEYRAYAENCSLEDAPLYLFDSAFVETTDGEMGTEYTPLDVFGRDLFQHFGAERPNFRWLIIGPARSGSTFHKDPNGTSAWNAVVHGRKGWVMFPGDILPPGVFVSQDEGEVTSPLSIAEWFESYFLDAWKVYGPSASDPRCRGKMKMGICEEGEVVFVPSGWWHLVVNLASSVAVTQNFVSEHELAGVLRFMRDKPAQISGFKPSLEHATCSAGHDLDELDEVDSYRASLYERFLSALISDTSLPFDLNRIHDAPTPASRISRGVPLSLAQKVTPVSGFAFGFQFDEDTVVSI